jgi:hypothetical protein
MQCAFPFVIRAAWIAARLGKPVLPTYKARFAKPLEPIDLREAGWGLLCMGLRHASLRGEVFKALQSPPRQQGTREAWVEQSYALFAQVAEQVQSKEDELREEALALGRAFVVVRTDHLPESSPYRFARRDEVPEDLVMPGLFDGWYDAQNGERGGDMMLIAVCAAARARAEDFYFPATVLHAMGPPDLEQSGESLVEMRRTLLGTPKTVRHSERPPGRNDPCPCGSGKKYKKCHGR